MAFSRQEYWSVLPCPHQWDLSNPGTELAFLMSPALAGRFFTTSATWDQRRPYSCVPSPTVLHLSGFKKPYLTQGILAVWSMNQMYSRDTEK